jgi:NADH dehydrogenase
MARPNPGELVTVLGGSGFLGRYAVRALAQAGWRVCAAVRRPELAGHLQPMGGVGQIYAVQANIREPASVRRVTEGARAVVNLVGILAPSGRQTFEAVHVAGARAAAKAARESGAATFVHVSALGADLKSKSRYGRTKAEGEAAVLSEFPGAVILRPSILFGPEDQFFNRFASMARFSPFLPLIGGGRTRFQPVYAADVGQAIATACIGAAKPGLVYELGGPGVYSFRQLLDFVQQWSERRRWYFPLPFWLAKLGAFLTAPLPTALRPLTVDQVRLLKRDNVVSAAAMSEGRTLTNLGVSQPQDIASVVPEYLKRFRPKGQFSLYRR